MGSQHVYEIIFQKILGAKFFEEFKEEVMEKIMEELLKNSLVDYPEEYVEEFLMDFLQLFLVESFENYWKKNLEEFLGGIIERNL